LQGELNCEAARQEGKVEQAATAGANLKQAGANTNIHAVVMLIITQNTGDTIFATTLGHVSDYV
jgi:hypothetical protein